MPEPKTIEACILAGGLSSRMGQDKGRLKLGRVTLCTHIQRIAREANFPTRVIRRDLVPRCGPLGGIYTALKTSDYDALLFLACDMPFITPAILLHLEKQFTARTTSIFVTINQIAGFPFILKRVLLPMVEEQLQHQRFSINALAVALQAKQYQPPRQMNDLFANLNTPDDWKKAQERLRNAAKNRSA